ncbi:MAG: hypothetical protein A3K19_32975 [Lentisphaerae bacterium RIFOXYB12_FULL_65_16]|nr:MAG: hypothetical protein A3K18_15250 [Lentisphaerae bacterium RIFOXYA12_64_32]OGV87049.1 MAG: hypothetical protein A3K19_32975 [Lentisphaerae bacterium RIFOXYB12_FULL_65_16]
MSNLNIRKLSASLGVAPSTVSRVLGGKARQYRISESTEQRVLAKARELGFRPNYFAHSLNTGRTHTVGLIFANTIDDFLGSIMEGTEAELRGTEYQMVVATCENDPALERLAMERMCHRQVDGIILYPSAMPVGRRYPTGHLRQMAEMCLPCVVIGRKVGDGVDHVLFDDEVAGKLAAERFLAAGCREFGLVTLPIECSANRGRVQGCVEALRRHGVPDGAIVTVGADTPFEPGDVARLVDIDALFGVNTHVALECAQFLSRLRPLVGLRIEAFGASPVYGKLDAHVRLQPMPAREMGRTATRLLLERIDDPKRPRRILRLPWP